MDKQVLKQYQYIVKEIEQLDEERQRLNAGMIGAAKVTGLPKGNGIGDRTGDMAVKMSALSSLLEERQNKAIVLQLEIEQALTKLEPQERVLMRARYLQGKTWEQIAEEMYYSYKWVCVLHERILKKLKECK